jgi:hypothetical protein
MIEAEHMVKIKLYSHWEFSTNVLYRRKTLFKTSCFLNGFSALDQTVYGPIKAKNIIL